jgi:hypothetical protein
MYTVSRKLASQPDTPKKDHIMTPTDSQRLSECQNRYHELATQIADIGYIAAGTIMRRYTRCANPRCRCHADPPHMHGPYWQWTTKTSGKTITRRLNPQQAAAYSEWIDNNKRLQTILEQMRHTAAQATQIILTQEPTDTPAKV